MPSRSKSPANKKDPAPSCYFKSFRYGGEVTFKEKHRHEMRETVTLSSFWQNIKEKFPEHENTKAGNCYHMGRHWERKRAADKLFKKKEKHPREFIRREARHQFFSVSLLAACLLFTATHCSLQPFEMTATHGEDIPFINTDRTTPWLQTSAAFTARANTWGWI